MTDDPRRSSIPKVIGILMIIFGLIGLMRGVISSVTGMAELAHAPMRALVQAIDVASSVLEVVGGVQLVRYQASGRTFANLYAIAELAVLLQAGISFTQRTGGSFGATAVVSFLLVFSAFPVVVLALVNRSGARASLC